MPKPPVKRIVVHHAAGEETADHALARSERFAGENIIDIGVHEVAALDGEKPVGHIDAGPCFAVVGFGRKTTVAAHVSKVTDPQYLVRKMLQQLRGERSPVFAIVGAHHKEKEDVDEVIACLRRRRITAHPLNIWWNENDVFKSIVVDHKKGRVHVFPSNEKIR